MRNLLFKVPFRKKSKVEAGDISALTSAEIYGQHSLENALPDYYGEVRPEVAARLYSSSPYINAAVNTIADYMSTVPLRVYSKSGILSPKRELTSGYPFKMIKYVNTYQTQTDFIKAIISWLVLTDNAFIAVEPSPPEFRKYSEFCLYPMNPEWVKIVPDPDTHVDVYIYEVNGKKLYFPRENVIHLKGFSPFNTWLGMSNLNALTSDIQIERYAKNMASKFYSNAATVSAVLTVESKLDDDEVRKLKRDFQTQYQGGKNAFRIVILEKGMTYEVPKNLALELNNVPAIENSAVSHSMVLGVPMGILTGSADGEELIDVEAVFWNKTLIPLGQQIAASFTKFLAWPVSTNLSIEFDYKNVAALRLQALDKARVDVAYISTGKNTPNEIRAQNNETPYTGEFADFGDMPFPQWQQEKQAELAKEQASIRMASQGTSASLTLPGSEGGRRDQSNTGEAQLLDQTGKRSLDLSEEEINNQLNELLNKFLPEEIAIK